LLAETVVDPNLNFPINFECEAVVIIFSVDSAHERNITVPHHLHINRKRDNNIK